MRISVVRRRSTAIVYHCYEPVIRIVSGSTLSGGRNSGESGDRRIECIRNFNHSVALRSAEVEALGRPGQDLLSCTMLLGFAEAAVGQFPPTKLSGAGNASTSLTVDAREVVLRNLDAASAISHNTLVPLDGPGATSGRFAGEAKVTVRLRSKTATDRLLLCD
jgi:hypothetical protein